MAKPTRIPQNWLLAIAVVTLAVLPLIFVRGDYDGADGQAQEAIQQLNPAYKPWVGHLFTPPSQEVASLLFATQAALGAGGVGFVVGYYKGRSERQQPGRSSPKPSTTSSEKPSE